MGDTENFDEGTFLSGENLRKSDFDYYLNPFEGSIFLFFNTTFCKY